MSLLRVLLVVSYTYENNFPWGLWLYAIILELNYLSECFAQYKFHSLNTKKIECEEATQKMFRNS